MRIGTINSKQKIIDVYMHGLRMQLKHGYQTKYIEDSDIQEGIVTNSVSATAEKYQYIDGSLLGFKEDLKIIVPPIILSRRDQYRKTFLEDRKNSYYTVIHEVYEPYGLVEFAMRDILFFIQFEGKQAVIEDSILTSTDECVQVPPGLIPGIKYPIVLPNHVMGLRDRIREQVRYEKTLSSITTEGGVEFLLDNDSRIIVRYSGKEVITDTDNIEIIHGRKAVKVKDFDLGHPYLELPSKVFEAIESRINNTTPEGLELISVGNSLLDGEEYFKLSKTLSDELFSSLKIYFEYFEEDGSNFSGWLTRFPTEVKNTLKLN